jgi:hypothetical protein
MQIRGNQVWHVVAALIAAWMAPGAWAQQRPKAFDDWWNRLIARGADGPDIDGIAISYRIDYRPQISPAELARLKAEAARHPESSAASTLAVLQATLSGGPSYRERTVWRYEGMWRINNTFARSPFAWDFVWGDGVGWQLTPKRLEVTPLTPGSAPAATLASESSGATYEIQLLLTGGLAGAHGRAMNGTPVLVAPGRWTFAGSRTDGQDQYLMTAEGGWDESRGWGTVTRSRFEKRASDGTVTWESRSLDDWRALDSLPLGIAGRVEIAQDDATQNSTITLQQIARFTRAEFKALTAVPGPNDTDPSRGKVTYTSIEDHRSALAREAMPMGLNDSVGGGVGGSRESSASKLRIAGWVTAGLLGSAILIIRIRRAMGGRAA